MKKRKLELYITGKLMSALMVGRPAIFSTGGEMYHTAPVVKIHETETQEIHFETSTTHYYIKPRPFVLAVLNLRRQTLARVRKVECSQNDLMIAVAALCCHGFF